MATLAALPDELLQQIADLLDRQSQKSLALVDQRAWDIATNALWRDVKLIDKRVNHWVPEELTDQWKESFFRGRDEHDDTPIIRKLLVLAKNKRIASKVRTLTHRCHLPLPAIFQELPQICFENEALSSDWRTIQLALLAVQNMDNVRVLRLLNGHYNLVAALLNGFYGSDRVLVPPHLWIESCTLRGFPLRSKSSSSAQNGLQSLRMRRLRVADVFEAHGLPWRYSRAGDISHLHNGIGSRYITTTAEHSFSSWDQLVSPKTFDLIEAPVKWLNDKTYDGVPEATTFLNQLGEDRIPYPIRGKTPSLRQQHSGYDDSIGIMAHFNSHSLRSLNLDWILTPRSPDSVWVSYQHFSRLSSLRFPNLRAMQLRNAVTDNTRLPDGIHLLKPADWSGTTASKQWANFKVDMLSFMENHPNIECLAWPMDGFYDSSRPSDEDQEALERAAHVVANLGRTLTTLRVDCYYTSRGEPQTDWDNDFDAKQMRIRRRRFISEFAAHMTKLKVLKVEGGIPRDEKRELIAATHHSPLEKIVMIGVSCPLGNTWGVNGDDLAAVDEGHLHFHGLLEPEPEEALIENAKSELVPASPKVPFKAEYGWPPGPSLLHSIAMHHASTLTELKFCGYNGSPVLHRPTAVTAPLLHHLRHFHRIRKVIMSFWLLTFFDFDWREPEIIDYWVNARDPNSLALQAEPEPALPPTPPNEAPSWEQMVSADAGLDTEGDTPMQDATAMAVELGSTMTALAALSGNVDSGGDMTADAMMAVALGTGIVGAAAQQNDNTVLPNTSNNPLPVTHQPETETQDATAPPVPTPETNPLDIALKQYISPSALSKGVYDIVGPHLSPIAKANGVQLRASFCLGVESGDIFDLDFDVDANGVVEGSWVGPREESEKGRWWSKLENRGWFG